MLFLLSLFSLAFATESSNFQALDTVFPTQQIDEGVFQKLLCPLCLFHKIFELHIRTMNLTFSQLRQNYYSEGRRLRSRAGHWQAEGIPRWTALHRQIDPRHLPDYCRKGSWSCSCQDFGTILSRERLHPAEGLWINHLFNFIDGTNLPYYLWRYRLFPTIISTFFVFFSDFSVDLISENRPHRLFLMLHFYVLK